MQKFKYSVSLGLPTHPFHLLSHQRFPCCKPGTLGLVSSCLGLVSLKAYSGDPQQLYQPATSHGPADQPRLAYTLCAGTSVFTHYYNYCLIEISGKKNQTPKISVSPVKHKRWVKLSVCEVQQRMEKTTYPVRATGATLILEAGQSNHLILRLMQFTFTKSTCPRKLDKYLRLRHKYLRRQEIVFSGWRGDRSQDYSTAVTAVTSVAELMEDNWGCDRSVTRKVYGWTA